MVRLYYLYHFYPLIIFFLNLDSFVSCWVSHLQSSSVAHVPEKASCGTDQRVKCVHAVAALMSNRFE